MRAPCMNVAQPHIMGTSMAAVSPIGTPAGKPQAGSSRLLTILKTAIIAILLAGSIYLLYAHSEWFHDPTQIKAEVVRWGAWGPIAYILLYAVGPSLLVPGAVMTIAGGLAFGTLWGSVYSLIGADIGAIVAFGAGRFLGKSFVERAVGERFHPTLERIARNGFQIVLYLRIVPVIPYNVFNLLAGASRISFRDYFWASVIGMVPGTILFAFLGDALWHPLTLRFLLALGLIGVSLGLGETWRRWSSVKLEG